MTRQFQLGSLTLCEDTRRVAGYKKRHVLALEQFPPHCPITCLVELYGSWRRAKITASRFVLGAASVPVNLRVAHPTVVLVFHQHIVPLEATHDIGQAQ